jgi:hypothetical protein
VVDAWIAVFVDSFGRRRWWDRFLKPGFRHVFVMSYDIHRDLWLTVDWGTNRVEICLMGEAELINLVAFVRRHDIEAYRLPIGKPSNGNLPRFPFWPFWCTDAVKHITGIRSWAITPWQLRQHLVSIGCPRAFLDEEHDDGESLQAAGAEQGPAAPCPAAGEIR